MRIIIAGGRDFDDYQFLELEFVRILRELSDEGLLAGRIDLDIPNMEIVSGTAKGADSLGEEFAKEYGIKIKQFPADWDNLDVVPCKIKYNSYGKPYNTLAGLNRNKDMAEYAKGDIDGNGILIAFWNGKSTGTKNMIDLGKSKKYGLRVFVIKY